MAWKSILLIARATIFVGAYLVLTDVSFGQEWAYPPLPPTKSGEDTILKQVPGSARAFTQAQTEGFFNPPDWYPQEHPPMPEIVSHGRSPKIQACARCHLPNGNGHPESSSLAGLSAEYMIRQMTAFKEGSRRGVRADRMGPFAKEISDSELKEAIKYFASLKPSPWTKVVEAQVVPETFVGQGAMRLPKPDGRNEPLGSRIIAVPESPERAELRDSHSGFIEYVPVGSIERGGKLVATGGEAKTQACNGCHGPALKGMNDIPAIAGRSPIYVVRQLQDIKTGRRTGPDLEPMRQVVQKLDDADIIDIAAYVGSLEP